MQTVSFYNSHVACDGQGAATYFRLDGNAIIGAAPCKLDAELEKLVHNGDLVDHVEHTILHTWLMERLGEPYSPVMFARAINGKLNEAQAHTEELTVCAFQALIWGKAQIYEVEQHFGPPSSPVLANKRMLNKLVSEWREWWNEKVIGVLLCGECMSDETEEGKATCARCTDDNEAYGAYVDDSSDC